MTAAEALWTDLLGMEQMALMKKSTVTAASLLPPHTWFYCGNFGMIILSKLWLTGSDGGEMAKTILQKMIQVTMMRGAQSGGVVTFIGGHADDGMRDELKHKTKGLFGVRARVVNTKRGDLSVGVRSKLEAAERGLALRGRGRVYAGHTRFATTSKASFDGTHPHQWSPRARLPIWSGFREVEPPARGERWIENFICHNGDFDFYTVGARTYDLDALQEWLPRATGHPMPCSVDSCAVAGMLDLLRAQGSWFLAARYAFHLGEVARDDVARRSLTYPTPSREALLAVADVFEHAFGEHVRGGPGNSAPKTVVALGVEGERAVLADEVATALRAGGHAAALYLAPRESTGGGEDGKELEGGATLLETFARSTVDAFFDNDLLFVARLFMANAKGSFGLCLTCSINAHRQVCLAARGQTISVAFFPRTGLVLYGSEQAAVKAALGVSPPKQPARKERSGSEQAAASPGGPLGGPPKRGLECAPSTKFTSSRNAATSPAEQSPGSSQRSKTRIKTKSFEQWKRDREGLEVERANDYEHGPAVRLDLDDLGGEASREPSDQLEGPTRGVTHEFDRSGR